MIPVIINGRFFSQPITGVQRFSLEMTAAIDQLRGKSEWPETIIAVPRGGPAVTYQNLPVHEVGHTRGHVWEQTELPISAPGNVVVSLGNTAPLLAGKRQVIVIHDAGVFDTPSSYSWRFRLWYKTLQYCLARTGAHIATVSAFSRQRIAARLGIDPARVSVIYEGAEHILRVPADRSVLDRSGLRPGKYVLVVGNLVAHKNLAMLHALAGLVQRHDMVIALAGGSATQVYRPTRAASNGQHLGRVTDAELRALYENAAFLFFPSRYEGFGLPPVEAMACGCPVLASRGGAVEEICKTGAFYFPSDKPDLIITAARRLLEEDGLADQLRARGREHVAALTWERSARALGDVVSRLTSSSQQQMRRR